MRKLSRIRKQNNKTEKHLYSDNLKHYYLILGKLRTLSLNEYHQEQIRQDILELIWQAQNRRESVSDIIGKDTDQFVASISDSVPRQTESEKRFIDFSIFLTVAQYMLIFFTLLTIRDHGLSIMTYNIIILIYFCIVSPYAILKFVTYLIEKEWSSKAILLVAVLSGLMSLPLIAMKLFNYETFFTVSSPTWWFIGLISIVVWTNWKIQKHIDSYYYTEL